MKKWEYIRKEYHWLYDENYVPKMNQMGEEGWELVSLIKEESGNCTAIYKREKE